MYKLRNYQAQASRKAQEVLSQLQDINKSPLIVLPTGAGKSLVIADITFNLDVKTLIISPSVEVTKQNKKKLLSYGVPEKEVAVYSASLNSKKLGKFTFGTIQSLAKNPEYANHFNLIIVDEAHKVSDSKTKSQFTKFFKNYKGKLLGFTATPYRVERECYPTKRPQSKPNIQEFYSKEKIKLITSDKHWFTNIIYNVDFLYLHHLGYLQRIKKTYAPTRQVVMKYPHVRQDVTPALGFAKHVTAQHGGTKVILWEKDKKSAELAHDESDPESKVYSITGSTGKKERARQVEEFTSSKHGEGVIVNYNALTTGFDAPALEVGIINKTVTSLPEYIQMQGRLTRVHPMYPDAVSYLIDMKNYDMPNIEHISLRPGKDFNSSQQYVLCEYKEEKRAWVRIDEVLKEGYFYKKKKLDI